MTFMVWTVKLGLASRDSQWVVQAMHFLHYSWGSVLLSGYSQARPAYCAALPACLWFVEPTGGKSSLSHRLKSANNEPCVQDGWPTSLPICLCFIPISESVVKPQSLPNMHSLLYQRPKKSRGVGEGIRTQKREWERERDQCCPKAEEWMRGTFSMTFRVLIRNRTASYLSLWHLAGHTW